MSATTIQQLMAVRGRPAVSVICPTRPTPEGNKEDPTRLHGLLAEAGQRLSRIVPDQEASRLVARLSKLEGEVGHVRAREGVGLFVSDDTASLIQFPVPVQPRVAVRAAFSALPLVAALNRSIRYRVLVLSEKPTRLFEGQWDELHEVRNDDFPLIHEGPGGAEPLPGGWGVNSSAHRDERHRQFFRDVDARLGVRQRRSPMPLIVIGVERYLAFFAEVTRNAQAIAATITGNHDRDSAAEIGRLASPLMLDHLASRDLARLDELDRAVGADRYASGVDQVWRAARERRGSVLFVEQSFRYPARLAGDGHLVPLSATSDSDASDDVVDEIIEHVVQAGGEVVVLPDGTLSQHQGIALSARY